MTIGIYLLYFNVGPETNVYIGQSTNIERRIKYEHLSRLIANKHENPVLQDAYNTYNDIDYMILEETDTNNLNSREVHWINIYDSYNTGLNLSPGGTGYSAGALHPDALYTDDVYLSILKLLAVGRTIQQVTDSLSVSIHVVRSIKYKEKHCYLASTYPEIYTKATTSIQKRGPSREVQFYQVISPLGEIHTLSNVNEFAKNNGLDQSNLRKLVIGQKKSYNGWKLNEILP